MCFVWLFGPDSLIVFFVLFLVVFLFIIIISPVWPLSKVGCFYFHTFLPVLSCSFVGLFVRFFFPFAMLFSSSGFLIIFPGCLFVCLENY